MPATFASHENRFLLANPLPLTPVSPLNHSPLVTIQSFSVHHSMPFTPTAANAQMMDDATALEIRGPLAVADALGRTAVETCRQHERLSHLQDLRVAQTELEATHALVDTCDLALAECVRHFEKVCATVPASDDAEVRQAANAMWLSSREYLRRHSIAEQASRQLTQHSVEKLNDLHTEYELLSSAILGLKHATQSYAKLRPDSR